VNRIVFTVLALSTVLVAAVPARADSSLSDAIAALKHARVYVAPDAEGATPETAKDLSSLLDDGDHIVIVMLPESAAPADDNLQPLIEQIEQGISGKHIVALAAGNSLADAGSNLLPNGVAKDQMNRASEAATSPQEALATFIGNMHDWLGQNPDAIATAARKVKAHDPSDGSGAVVIAALAAMGSLLCALGAFYVVRKKNQVTPPWDDFSDAPPDVQKQLRRVKELHGKITDPQARSLVEQVCGDTNEYYKSGSDRLDEDPVVSDLLRNLVGVLNSYLRVQNHIREGKQRYYLPENANEVLLRHLRAIGYFAEYIRSSVARNVAMELEGFQFNDDVLRYASTPDPE